MRKCPKCGFSDNPLWENCRFKRDLKVMRVEDFVREYPQLAERVMKEKYVRDGQFVYHKTSKYVLRKEPADFNQPFWEMFESKGRKKIDHLSKFGNLRQREKATQQRLLP